MCLLLLAVDVHPRYRLVVAANRDEWFARAADQAHPWEGPAGVVAGVDREAGGTWLGVTRSGRFAALTNFRDRRDMRPRVPDEPSRGELVRGFLEGDASPADHLRAVTEGGERYRGFNLVAGDASSLVYTSNRAVTPAVPRVVEPGVHGLSNHLLDTPWPKVRRGVRALGELLEGGREADVEALFAMLQDETIAPDDELPSTGVGLEGERMLSPMFIRSPAYGTRCSTVVLFERSGRVTFVERTHAPEPRPDVRFEIAPP